MSKILNLIQSGRIYKVRSVNSSDFCGIVCNFSSNFTFSKFFMLVGTFVLFKIALCYDPYAFLNLTVKIVKGHFCLTIVEDLKLANDRPTFALSNFTFLSAVDLILKQKLKEMDTSVRFQHFTSEIEFYVMGQSNKEK